VFEKINAPDSLKCQVAKYPRVNIEPSMAEKTRWQLHFTAGIVFKPPVF
jgi:hypothetical protein